MAVDDPILVLSPALEPYAEIFRKQLRAKIYAWGYVIDMRLCLARFPALGRKDVIELTRWYESNLISTTFEVINDIGA